MYTRRYRSPSGTAPSLPPDYGGTALVIPHAPPPEEPPVLPPDPIAPPPPAPEAPPPADGRPSRPGRSQRPLFSGRRGSAITPPAPGNGTNDPRRPEDRPTAAGALRDPLGAPPFGGLGHSSEEETAPVSVAPDHREEATAVSPLSLSLLALRQDDLLLLGLLLFLLHEQDGGNTDCRDALLLLAVLFVAGM